MIGIKKGRANNSYLKSKCNSITFYPRTTDFTNGMSPVVYNSIHTDRETLQQVHRHITRFYFPIMFRDKHSIFNITSPMPSNLLISNNHFQILKHMPILIHSRTMFPMPFLIINNYHPYRALMPSNDRKIWNMCVFTTHFLKKLLQSQQRETLIIYQLSDPNYRVTLRFHQFSALSISYRRYSNH